MKTTPMKRNPYITDCVVCGYVTSKRYAQEHKGMCRPCFTGEERKEKNQHDRHESDAEYRNRIIIDHGYDAYAREEGHYE
jgi:hypothetical protein